MKRYALPLAIFSILCASSVSYFLIEAANTKLPALTLNDASGLRRTAFIPALQTPFQKDRNLVWCGTFQLAWNELMEHIGGKVELAGAPPEAAWLNQRLFDETMIDSGSAFAGIATNDSELNNLHRGMQRHFGRNIDAGLPNLLEKNTFITYSMLLKSMSFKDPLQSLDEPIQFKGSPVEAFGLKAESSDFDSLSGQIKIHDYKHEDDFVLELITTARNDQLLIAKVNPNATMLETVHAVLSRRQEQPDRPLQSEPVHIPKLDFNYTASFPDLQKRKIKNKTSLRDQELAATLQSVRFKLDEKGAELESRASIMMVIALSPKPRTFIVDKPFLILMLRKDAPLPYFAMWVDNAEMLVPAK